MLIYHGTAILDDGAVQHIVHVKLCVHDDEPSIHPFSNTAPSTNERRPRRWDGRILSKFDPTQWSGKAITITLPNGRSGIAIAAATGAINGSGEPPLDNNTSATPG